MESHTHNICKLTSLPGKTSGMQQHVTTAKVCICEFNIYFNIISNINSSDRSDGHKLNQVAHKQVFIKL